MAQSAAPSSSSQQQAFHSASLYVGDLDPDVTEALLFEVFNAVGPVASIRVCRDGVTRRSLGYGYVNFHNTSDAERALDTMNYTSIRGRACRIMWSQRDPSLRKTGAGNVFVKNLDESIDNKALFDTFSLFGNILSCKVVCDKAGKSRGYGFVHYETVGAAEEAIRKINGMLIANKTVFVGHFVRRENRETPNTWTNVYVKNLPEGVDEDSLRKVFSSFGDVTSCVVMKGSDGRSKCFGFVNFDSNDSAQACVQALNGKFLDAGLNVCDEDPEAPAETEASAATEPATEASGEESADGKQAEETPETADAGEEKAQAEAKTPEKPRSRPLYLGRAQKKFERQKELRERFDKIKAERLRKYDGVNLYVKNLDENVDDERLRTEFSRFGTITSTRVMRDENSHSKGFGFVCFASPEEATAAITELNGKMLAGKPLYVALAQRKEVRRQALESQYAQRGMAPMMGRGMPVGQPPVYGMYYQGGPSPPFMYPGQMARGPQAGQMGHPAMYARGGYQPMPAGYPRQQMGRGRGPQRPNAQAQAAAQAQAQAQAQAAAQAQAQAAAAAQAQAQQIKFTAAARNMQQQQQQQPVAAPVVQQQQLMVQQLTGLEPLTASTLASVSADQQKNMIGERLYPLIHQIQPELAGKITGMLLEMDNGELLHLLESPDALHAKIQEALQVLDAHRAE